MLAISTKAATACATAARRITSIGKYSEKYRRQITMPESSSTSRQATSVKNSSFWPAL